MTVSKTTALTRRTVTKGREFMATSSQSAVKGTLLHYPQFVNTDARSGLSTSSDLRCSEAVDLRCVECCPHRAYCLAVGPVHWGVEPCRVGQPDEGLVTLTYGTADNAARPITLSCAATTLFTLSVTKKAQARRGQDRDRPYRRRRVICGPISVWRAGWEAATAQARQSVG
jgi:hypothetical protein